MTRPSKKVEGSAFLFGLVGSGVAIAAGEYFMLSQSWWMPLTILAGGLCGLLSRYLPERLGGAPRW